MHAHDLLAQIAVADVDDAFHDGQRALLTQLREIVETDQLFSGLPVTDRLLLWLDEQDRRYDGVGDCLVATRKVRHILTPNPTQHTA